VPAIDKMRRNSAAVRATPSLAALCARVDECEKVRDAALVLAQTTNPDSSRTECDGADYDSAREAYWAANSNLMTALLALHRAVKAGLR